MLKVKFKDNRQEPFWVMEKSYSIGSSKDNHLVIDDSSISSNHARIIRDGEHFNIRDLAGSSGTFVNGKRISNSQITCGDNIQVGGTVLEIIDPLIELEGGDTEYWSLIADSSWLSGQEFRLVLTPGKPVILGRASQCDIVIPGTHLSRQHAQITNTGDELIIEDLSSANGTYVNDKKISRGTIKPGDRIRLDVYSFRVFGPGIDLPKSATTSFHAIVKDTDLASKPSQAVKTPINSGKPKAWKTRPTSPGNREEPTYSQRGKIFGWLVAFTIIALFTAVAVYVTNSV